MRARTVTVKVKYADFQLITRSKTDKTTVQSKQDILEIIPELIKKTEIGVRPIRLIGISLSGLASASELDSSIQSTPANNQQQIRLFN